jgi:hypothetical protein
MIIRVSQEDALVTALFQVCGRTLIVKRFRSDMLLDIVQAIRRHYAFNNVSTFNVIGMIQRRVEVSSNSRRQTQR